MIVLDTTVLVYAVGVEHPLKAPCQLLIRAIAEGGLVGTTTIEVIQEFTQIRARRRAPKDAAEPGIADLWPQRSIRPPGTDSGADVP